MSSIEAFEPLPLLAGYQAGLLTDLNDSAIMSATGAHWESAEQDFLNLDSDIRGTAMVISALAQLAPDSPLLPPAVRWLMNRLMRPGWFRFESDFTLRAQHGGRSFSETGTTLHEMVALQ